MQFIPSCKYMTFCVKCANQVTPYEVCPYKHNTVMNLYKRDKSNCLE